MRSFTQSGRIQVNTGADIIGNNDPITYLTHYIDRKVVEYATINMKISIKHDGTCPTTPGASWLCSRMVGPSGMASSMKSSMRTMRG